MRKLGAMVAVLGCGLTICGALALGAGLQNGDFEKGSFKGWSHKQEGDSGDWYVYKNNPRISQVIPDEVTMRRGGAPQEPRLPKPIQGRYAAATAQSGPGTQMLFRKLKLKPNHQREISFLLRYRSYADLFSPNSLHAAQDGPPSVPRGFGNRGVVQGGSENQQFRVDVMRKQGGAYSLKSHDILKNLLASKPSDPKKRGWKRYSFALSSLPAGKVKLRVAQADNVGNFIVAFDDLQLEQKPKK